MKALLLLFFILTGYIYLPAQAQDSTHATIKPGDNATDVLTQADMYYYPQFTNGNVFFLDGSKAMAKLNYNRLFDQMLFINPKGDTLALADEKIIRFIAIGRDTFYFDKDLNKGYIRLITGNSFVKLAEKQIWEIADFRKIGSHNRPATTVAITSLSILDDNTAAKSHDLTLNENTVLRKETQYYFGDKYNYFVRAGKKRVLEFFGKEQQGIEDYFKKNKVNFDDKADLEKLTQFLVTYH